MKLRLATQAIAGLVLMAVVQVYVAPAFASTPSADRVSATTPQQQITGILTTKGNQPVMVNGTSVNTGATIVGGSVIETLDGSSASVAFPGHGSLDISPKSRMSIQIDAAGNIIIKIIGGCVSLHLLKGTAGEVDKDGAVVGKSDGSTEMTIDACPNKPGSTGAAHHGLFGLGIGATIAIIAAAGGGAALAADLTFFRGNRNTGVGINPLGNPSPSGL